MKRLVILAGLVITSVAAALCNLEIARLSGLNIFSLKLWSIFPVGAIFIGMVAYSGGLLVTRLVNVAPRMIDVVIMAALAALTVILIYYLNYLTAVFDDGQRASKIMTFVQYLNREMMISSVMFGRGARDVGEVSQLGYVIAAGEIIGFFFGGLSVFFILLEMELCEFCDVYLKKLKSKESNILEVDDAVALTEALKEGDLEVVSEVLHWSPQTIPPDEKGVKRGKLHYELWVCPDCKSEQVVAKVKMFDGRNWSEVSELTTSRNLGANVSLLDHFAI
jgi:hypothetical protein